MAIYKVLQDIEAEDKFVGPLTLKQFIFMAIAFVSGYLSFFFATRHIYFLLAFLLPVMLVAGFLGFPFKRDQPTEIWLLAKLRFLFKPRIRIWDQSGVIDLVTITAPKKVERYVANDLSQVEVKSRLKALAETIDSRGWAAKDANVNLYQPTVVTYDRPDSDRLVGATTLPQRKSPITTDVNEADDMMDEKNNPRAHRLGEKMVAAAATQRQKTLKHMQAVRTGKAVPKKPVKEQEAVKPDYWFMNQPDASMLRPGYAMFGSRTVQPGAEEKHSEMFEPMELDLEAIKKKPTKTDRTPLAYGHTKVIMPLGQQEPPAPPPPPPPVAPPYQALVPPPPPLPTPVTPPVDPAILNLASNDDLSVATIAREANKQRNAGADKEPPKDEVVISLH